jgi:hypothetical protein
MSTPIVVNRIALVCGNDTRTSRLSDTPDNLSVKRGNAFPRVNHNDTNSRVFDGKCRLRARLIIKRIFRDTLIKGYTASINKHDLPVSKRNRTRYAVARNTGLVENDRDFLFRESVKKRTLSRIGPAY